jgi:hypothetical protein
VWPYRLEGDFVAESFELLDEATCVSLSLLGSSVVEEELAEVLVGLVAGEHVVGGDKDRVGDSDRRFAVTAAAASRWYWAER